MNIDIASRLYELRKKNNYSQEELAEKIGVSRQAVSKWERAEASPDTDNLILLSKIYNISMDELLSTEEPVESRPQIKTQEQLRNEKEDQYEEESSGNAWMAFPYPIFVTIIFLILGFVFNLWHPGWLVYLTIPLYYAVVANMGKKNKRK